MTVTAKDVEFWRSLMALATPLPWRVLAVEAVNVTMATIATETTAPTSVTFTNAAVSSATMLSIGNIPATQFKGIWVKNVINAAAAPVNDSFTINVTGDSAP